MLSESSSVKASPEDKAASAPCIRRSAKISRRVTLTLYTRIEFPLLPCSFKGKLAKLLGLCPAPLWSWRSLSPFGQIPNCATFALNRVRLLKVSNACKVELIHLCVVETVTVTDLPAEKGRAPRTPRNATKIIFDVFNFNAVRFVMGFVFTLPNVF